MCSLEPQGVIILKISGLGQRNKESCVTFLECLCPRWGEVPIIKHQTNIIVNLNIHRSQGVGEAGFLHLLLNH
jgi:hypothetical protein